MPRERRSERSAIDPDLFITIAFCSLVFGFAVGAALLVRSALRGDPDSNESEQPDLAYSSQPTPARRSILETSDVSQNKNASLTRQGGGANGIHDRSTA